MENGKLFRTTLNHYIPLDVIIKLEHFTLTHLNHYIPLDVIIKLVHFTLPHLNHYIPLDVLQGSY